MIREYKLSSFIAITDQLQMYIDFKIIISLINSEIIDINILPLKMIKKGKNVQIGQRSQKDPKGLKMTGSAMAWFWNAIFVSCSQCWTAGEQNSCA